MALKSSAGEKREKKMKDILIYGALVAAVLGVSSTLLTNLRGTLNNQGTAVNTAIGTQAGDLVSAISN